MSYPSSFILPGVFLSFNEVHLNLDSCLFDQMIAEFKNSPVSSIK